jgi:pre-mRNA-processing factor 6
MSDDEDIWVASVKLEIISDNFKISQNLLSQALQKCPSSGKLWALFIELEPAATRKAQVMNALKANENDANLFVAVAKVFWVDRKGEKIRKWLSNAVKSNKDNGDAWAHLLRYELEFGTAESK